MKKEHRCNSTRIVRILSMSVLLFGVAFSVPHDAKAEMFKWVDKKGVIHFSDRPPAEKKADIPPEAPVDKTKGTEQLQKATAPQRQKSEKSVVYHGNIVGMIFHQPGCRYYNCKNCIATFPSREAAIKAGYRPCKICKP